jgi:hypothetical protein
MSRCHLLQIFLFDREQTVGWSSTGMLSALLFETFDSQVLHLTVLHSWNGLNIMSNSYTLIQLFLPYVVLYQGLKCQEMR